MKKRWAQVREKGLMRAIGSARKVLGDREGAWRPPGGILSPQKELLFCSVPVEAVWKPCWDLYLHLGRTLAFTEPGLLWNTQTYSGTVSEVGMWKYKVEK